MANFLYLDCGSGASGDMLLGSLLDLGVPLEVVREALGSLALEGVDVMASRVTRAGISATKFDVTEAGRVISGPPAEGSDAPEPARPSGKGHEHRHSQGDDPSAGHGPGTDHSHEHAGDRSHEHQSREGGRPHAHRHLPAIVSMIGRSALSPTAREKAIALMERMAAAEAAIHGIPIERVHLHEVGAVDSIVDIVGAVRAFEWLGIDDVWASPLNTGSGTVRCAHGTYPVPAPATLQLSVGAPIYADGPAVELLTPTGALLVTGYATTFAPLPPLVVERIGYGAGGRDFPGRPNVLRAVTGERMGGRGSEGDTIVVVEFEVDDMNPQWLGPFMDACLETGAVDVFYTPILMKKGRPGTLVTILAAPNRREALTALAFRETTSIGVRYHERRRECLTRRVIAVATMWGPIRVKLASNSEGVLNVAPEFEDCAEAARTHSVPLKTVHAAALHAYMSQGEP